MTLEALATELTAIMKVHPEAKDTNVLFGWKEDNHIITTYVKYVRYDTRHHPSRIILED